eukprot:5224741-Pleurochrysis_carterae.AAC.1
MRDQHNYDSPSALARSAAGLRAACGANVAALLAATAASGGNVRLTNANKASLPSTNTPVQSVHAQAPSSRPSCSASRGACDSRNGQSGTSSVHDRSSRSFHSESGGSAKNSDAESAIATLTMKSISTIRRGRPAARKQSVFNSARKRSRDAAHCSSADNTTTNADNASTTSCGNRSASSSGSSRRRR